MHIVFVILIFFAVSLDAAELDLSSFPVPHNASLQLITEHAKYNGVDVSIAVLKADTPLSESIEFYRSVWKEPVALGMPGFIQTQSQGWIYVSRVSQGISSVVQLDHGSPDKTFGYVSQTRVTEPAKIPEDPDFREFRRLSSTMSRDGSVVSVFNVYSSHSSVERTIDRSMRYLVNRGWSLIAGDRQKGSRSAVFTRYRERLEVVAVSSDQYPSLMVVNKVMQE
jgi:hypothetical protein